MRKKFVIFTKTFSKQGNLLIKMLSTHEVDELLPHYVRLALTIPNCSYVLHETNAALRGECRIN
uniref:Uncharacterized protein n=1 Tax=Vibrio vulnificus TaxID=672 RepID=A0A6S4Q6S2_VIBVL|nr:hypothetical protein [Vibrio vulnificus]